MTITNKNAPLAGALSENALNGYLFRMSNKGNRRALIWPLPSMEDN